MSEAEFYKACQRDDEWEGESYDGTSVRAAFKQLQKAGMVSEYRWAFRVGPMVSHILAVGPVVVGTDWHMSMFQEDRHGYIYPGTGTPVGGHAYLVAGADTKRKNPDGTTGAVRIVNSWGKGWADRGRAWITLDAMDALLRYDGECATATEVRLTRS